MKIQMLLFPLIFEHTWQTLTYQNWAIAGFLAVLAAAPFLYLARPTRNRAGSPGIMTIGVVIALGGFGMVNLMMNVTQKRMAGFNDGNALEVLGNIYNSELKFREKNGRFGILAELANEGLEGKPLADGKPIHGYKFTSSDVTDQTFCIHADRIANTSGFRDCNVTETGDFRCLESEVKGTVLRGQGKDPFDYPH